MQIIAGTHRSRKLAPLLDSSIRPTSARAREALFNILSHRLKENGTSVLAGARFADLCCGSGAIGLEARSRGAAHVTFVDNAATALAVARRNAETLKEVAQCHFMQGDVCALAAATIPYDIVFIDPPYGENLLPKAVARLVEGGWLHADSVLITEQKRQSVAVEHTGLTLTDTRHYGENLLRIYSL
jgi:16S rRNA (guanine966-N2)-methyltransferase